MLEKKRRTNKQNRSLHLLYEQTAKMLNDEGYDMRAVINPEIDILWSAYTVKEHLWRPIQDAYMGERSTTKLSRTDIDKIYDVINKAIAERTGLNLPPFPSINEQLNNYK